MATIEATYRYKVEGGDAVTQSLDNIGDAAAENFQRIDQNTGRLENNFNRLDRNVRRARGGFRQLAQSAALVEGPLGGTAARLTNISNSLRNFGVGATLVGGALSALGVTVGLAARQFTAAEESILGLQGALQATGNAAGFTLEELDDLARNLGRDTLTNANEARDAIRGLTAFTSIQGDQFSRTVELAQDLATVFGRDLRGATQLLGRALEDPVDGLESLTRVIGVGLVEDLRTANEELLRTGDIAGAQANVLDALEDRIGGVAEAAAGGTAGRADSLAEAWNEFLEVLGRSQAIIGPINALLTGLTGTLQGLQAQIEESREAAQRAEQIAGIAGVEEDPLGERAFIGAEPGGQAFETRRQAAEELLQGLESLAEVERDVAVATGQAAAERDRLAQVERERVGPINEFVEALQQELEINRLSEAQQRVQVALRDELAQATEAERDQAVALIEQIEREEAARERALELQKEEERQAERLARALQRRARREQEEATERRLDRVEREADQISEAIELLAPFRDQIAGITEEQRQFLDQQDQLRSAFATLNTPLEEQTRILEELRDQYRETSAEAQAFANTTVDALVELARTGRFEVRAFIEDLLAQFLRLQLQQNLAPALSAGFASIFGGLFSGGAGAGNPGAGATGFQFGGAFRVPGAGGRDSVGVGFLATPGESVAITRPGQGIGGNVQIIDQRGASAPPIETQTVGAGPDQVVRAIIKSEVNRGLGDGSFDQGLGSFGARPRPVRRG